MRLPDFWCNLGLHSTGVGAVPDATGLVLDVETAEAEVAVLAEAPESKEEGLLGLTAAFVEAVFEGPKPAAA